MYTKESKIGLSKELHHELTTLSGSEDLLSNELLLELFNWIRDNHPKCSDFDVRGALVHLAKTDFIKILR